MKESIAASEIVNRLLTDMNGRKGFRQNWDDIDNDIKLEIINTWKKTIVEALRFVYSGTDPCNF